MSMNEIRRKDRAIINMWEMEEILEKSEYGILSTVNEDGTPYAVPVSYVYYKGKIYFHCAKDVGHKVENIKNNNSICFTVVGKTQVLVSQFSTIYESVIASGRAENVESEELKAEVFKKILEKYCQAYIDEGLMYMERAGDKASVYEIDIESMTGKARRK